MSVAREPYRSLINGTLLRSFASAGSELIILFPKLSEFMSR